MPTAELNGVDLYYGTTGAGTNLTYRWHRRVIVAVLAGLVTTSACTRSDGAREAAWAIVANHGRPAPLRALLPGDDGTGRVPATTVQVRLGGCEPRRPIFSPDSCFFSLAGQDRSGLHVDEDDAAVLTASATLIFRGEYRTTSGEVLPFGRFGTTEVGPLRFGERVDVAFGGGGAADPITEGFAVADGSVDRYRIRVSVSGCRVSNNSACGNGAAGTVFSYRGPNSDDTVASSQQGLGAEEDTTSTTAPNATTPPDPGATSFALPDTLAGLQGSPALYQREGESSIDYQARQQAELAFRDGVAARLGLQELAGSRYVGGAQDHTILGVHPPHNVILYAGRHIELMAEAAIAELAAPLLTAAFEATFVAGRDDAQLTFGPVRQHDTGSPALHVGCTLRTLTAQGVTLQHPVCGWVDQHTIGVVQGTAVVVGVEPTIEHAEAQTARLVTAMRAELPPVS